MPTCRILVYLAVWKRPEITEICFQGIKRLQAHPDFEIEAVAVISEEEMIPLCTRYGVNWVMAENHPLGRKKNAGLQYCKNFEFDFLMEIGSDDLIMTSLLDDYKKFMVKYDFFGVREMAFLNSQTGECKKWNSRTLYGAGRLISRKALDAVGWKLWQDHLNKGLDMSSVINLHKKGIVYWQIPPGEYPKAVDIKSEVNIWKFDYSQGTDYDFSLIIDHLSREEKESLRCLLQRKRSEEWIEG
jgi:hypothetical protein